MLLYDNKIKESSTLRINTVANNKTKLGEKVYNFSVGEPIIDNCKIIVDNVYDVLKRSRAGYPPSIGVSELIDLSVEWFNVNFNSCYNTSETMITCGGKYAISLTLQAILDPNDEVIIISPYWVSYPEMIKIFNGIPKIYKTYEENNWQVNIDELKKSINKNTKAIIINNASNPTGHVFSENELKGILKLAYDNDIFVISDEVYSGLVYDDNKFISSGKFKEFKDKVIVIQSCSKNFGMTGWRVGMIFASREIIGCLGVLQSQSITNTSIVSQWAAMEALRHAETITEEIKNTIQKRRDIFISTFNELFPVKIKAPQSSLYIFVRISNLGVFNKKSDDLAMELIDKANIAITSGSGFGEDDYIRFSFGINEVDIVDGLNVLKNYLDFYDKE